MRKPAKEPVTQAERVIAKFGGPTELSRILNYTLAAVCKWTYPRTKGGCHGLIPTRALDRILSTARLHGVLLTEEDLKPRTL